MKYTWEIDDIQCGVLARSSNGTELFLVGYTHIDDQQRPCLVSLNDGLVTHFYDLKSVVEELNGENMTPVFVAPNTEMQLILKQIR